MAISHCYWHLVVKNGNFTFLLTSSGQEWQFHIATDIATEISTMRAHICQVSYVILLWNLILAGQVCRWSAQLGQIYLPKTCQMKWPRSDVNSNFQMKYPDMLQDLSPQIVRWSDQDEVHTEIIYEFIFQMKWPYNLSAHSLSLSCSLSHLLSQCNLLLIGKYADLIMHT